MNTPVISRLVVKDLLLWRKMIMIFLAVGLASIAIVSGLYGRVPRLVFYNLGFTLLIAPTTTLGIVLLMQTNVFEKAKSTQLFVMSLPVTRTDFKIAKLLVNLPIFTLAWLATTAVAFYFMFGLRVLPTGAIPFMTMVFLGIYVAYLGILCVSLLSQSLGVTIIGILFFEVLTSAYLWVIVFLKPIGDHILSFDIVWNSTVLTILTLQIIAGIALVAAAVCLQGKTTTD